MAVALVTTPDDYALTRGGRMRYAFTGSGRSITSGVKAINVLGFRNPIPDGTRFVFRWNSKVVEVLAKNIPQAPNEFLAGNGSAAYMALIEPFFAEYFPFRDDFTVEGIDYGYERGIVFTAKEAGAAYTISGTSTRPITDLTYIGNPTPGIDPQTRTQYSIYTELWLQRLGTDGTLPAHFDRVFSAPIECDADGRAEFDAGGVLHAELSADWPAWSVPTPRTAVNSHRQYFLAYGEAWGWPLQVGRVKSDTVRHAYFGGADYQQRAGSGYDLYEAIAAISLTQDGALRFGSRTRYVRPDEPQFLTFVNVRQAATAVLHIELYFSNNTNLVVVNALPEFPYAPGQKIAIPVGHEQLALANRIPGGRSLLEYRVRLMTAGADPGGNNFLSAQYRYILNYDYQPFTRYFAYLNSLGAVETLATFGKGSVELNRFTEQAERYLPAQYDVADGQFVDYNVTVQQQITVTTGYRDAGELLDWTDFYRASSRFQLLDGRALPISVVSKSIQQAKDDDTLFAHKFEYAYLYKEDFYSASSAGNLGDEVPPVNFVSGGGTITIQPVQVVQSIDPTVPNAAREITPAVLDAIRTVIARPNPETQGYLTEQVGSQVFRHRNIPITFTELTGKPATRDEAGLLDVPNNVELVGKLHAYLNNLIGIRPQLSSWTTSVEPQ